MRFRYGVASNVGLVRQSNEDSYLVREGLFVVCDGMGGARGGEVASETACNALLDVDPRTADPEVLREAVIRANAAIVRRSLEEDQLVGMGTTLTAAMAYQGNLVFAQVGDSRGYLLHEGELRQVTSDHSWVAEMIRRGELTPAQAAVHPHRSVITRALGTEGVVEPDIVQMLVAPEDRLLLCSDGLSGMVLDAEIEELLKRAADPQQAADSLVEAALESGGEDNVTVVVVFIETAERAGDSVTADLGEVLVGPLDRGLVGQATVFGKSRKYGTGVRRRLGGRALLRPVRARPSKESADAGVPLGQASESEAEGGAEDGGTAGQTAERTTDHPVVVSSARSVSSAPAEPSDTVAAVARRGWTRRRWTILVSVIILVVVVAVAGFALYNSTVYYVGTDNGNLALYNGLPGSILGVQLSTVVEEGRVPYSVLQPSVQAQVDAHTHVTKEEGQRFIRSLGAAP